MNPRLKIYLKRLSENILWRIVVGVLACVGFAAILMSLLNEGAFHSIYLKQQANNQVELISLFRMFIPDIGRDNRFDWKTNSEISSPIEWETYGICGHAPEDEIYLSRFFARHGKTHVTINGKPSHAQFGTNLHPAVWNVSMYGPKMCVSIVQFGSDGDCTDNPMDAIMEALAKYMVLKESHPESGYTFVGRLYKTTLPGKEPCWLVQSWSGHHSFSFTLTLFLGKDLYPEARQYLLDLL